MAKIILVASGKGGAGKSTVSALLGEALAFSGKRVLLLELDSGLRSLDVALGVTKNLVFDLGDIVRGSADIQSAAMPCPFCKNLSVICAAANSEPVSKEPLQNICAAVSADFDCVILDCPAGIGESLSAAAEVADLALVVATPDPSSIRAAGAAGRALRAKTALERRLVIERCPKKARKLAPINNLDEIIDGAELQLIGVIWEDPETRRAMDSGSALSPDSPNHKAFRDLGKRVFGERVPLGFK